MLIAWALVRAADQWHEPQFLRYALKIFDDLAKSVVKFVNGRVLLLPGMQGFTQRNCVVINLSYYIFPALQAAARIHSTGPWENLIKDGVRLIENSLYGMWKLPPDWVAVQFSDDHTHIAKRWPPRFSYDAIRIPLYMVWGGVFSDPLKQNLDAFWQHWGIHAIPGWVDLPNGTRSPYNAPAGFQAVAIATDPKLAEKYKLPSVRGSGDYYSACLTMLAHIVSMENAHD
ncbi:hypothetical protein A0U89_15750 (plasmid) [Kozakia baliensis]|uniref:cellulase n=1 Tax=Kozakia baliensis TaxID=153496 RepID=A0A1D8UYI1_9PROT|nr:hypothetical protein A0U89_15750 [Kozakia baliensis]